MLVEANQCHPMMPSPHISGWSATSSQGTGKVGHQTTVHELRHAGTGNILCHTTVCGPFVHTGFGSMPTSEALVGIPYIGGSTSATGRDTTPPTHDSSYNILSGASVSVTLSNLFPLAGAALVPVSEGEYVGDGLHPVPTKVATKIQRWEFIKMGELLPEFLASQGKDNLEGKCEPRIRRS